ncbi:AglZ/HisF2 family acetamidino modification protein [Janthinobacterium rivuli]|uniref:imidazole glycerol-phosphate synthase n=1 Tax=Janthinobacterium rivuli TaxID=2751478 RepID=A0ABY8I255_9BURK|nr:AglZ/HisF2 family acetamidino modification protein [Janthinobacterium rivuli]PHV33382.1 imidazole glycerol phosphate synthase subunit HisF [Janthinobacterium sp. BJB312]WFR78978.1 AglZ/HisF2 family acetamidino modification protein [Janthinobacterium rivuli]
MLRARIIPCLLLKDGGLVKSVKFKDHKYVGDPINAVKIFNEKEVDEIVVLDIDASAEGREPNYRLIENLARECRMPLCYGGGIKTVQQANRIFALGVEKIAISSAAVSDIGLVSALAAEVGSQSVVVILDVKKRSFGRGYEIYINNGKTGTGLSPVDFCKQLQEHGVGEICINAIDRDGMMEGYDLDLISAVHKCVKVPMTVLGGAGSLDHIKDMIARFGIIGVAAGSLFVFKGAYKAVLISYPSRQERGLL